MTAQPILSSRSKRLEAKPCGKRWYRQIVAVLGKDVLLKGIGTTLFIFVFFNAYFYLLSEPAYPATVMPTIFLDRFIGFHPLAFLPYVSLWVYVSLPPALIATRRELYAYGRDVAGVCLIGFVFFYFWPTVVPVAAIDWTLYPLIDFLKDTDLPGNAFPSLHVATAGFSGMWLHKLLNRFGAPGWMLCANWIWCAAIVYSTLATRQHVVVDVLAGLVLGVSAAGLSLHYRMIDRRHCT